MDFMNTSIIDFIINLKYETNISIYNKDDNSIMFIITYTDDEIFEKTIFKEWLISNYSFNLESISKDYYKTEDTKKLFPVDKWIDVR